VTIRPTSAGDAVPPACRIIEVRVGELRQLFNAIDPSPFNERDLDPKAEEFIVGWSADFPGDAPLALVVHLDRAAGRADEALALRAAIHEFFSQRALSSRRRLRELFRRGRISLAIALAFLALSIGVVDTLVGYLGEGRAEEILREGLLIIGWVAMWRPLELFLYDWWPIRAEARLFDRLSAMPVRIDYAQTNSTEAWRSDWPAAPASDQLPIGRPPTFPAQRATISQGHPQMPDTTNHHHTPEEERRIREAALDQTIEGSFPASDPPSTDPNPDDHTAIEKTNDAVGDR